MDNKTTDKPLSVVIPVYNEAEVIDSVIRDYYTKLISRVPNIKFIIAEDGSTDGTKDILEKLKNEIPFVLISGKERKGYTRAFKDALSLADTEWVFFSDSDAQHDPEDIFRMLATCEDYDIISGLKTPRYDPWYRLLISKVFNFLIYLRFGLKMRDINSGFKLIRREVILKVLGDVKQMKYCVMSEFVLRAHMAGFKIKEIPVTHYPRKSGASNIFQPTRLPRIIFGLIQDLSTIKAESRQERKL